MEEPISQGPPKAATVDQGLSVIDAGRSFDGLRTNGRALSVRGELVEPQQFRAQVRKPNDPGPLTLGGALDTLGLTEPGEFAEYLGVPEEMVSGCQHSIAQQLAMRSQLQQSSDSKMFTD